jgi:soluble lytic murein transglycosylase
MKTKRGRTRVFSVKTIVILLIISIACGIVIDTALSELEKRVYPREYLAEVKKASNEFGVPESIILSVIKTESDFDKTAISSAPAHGLMQLTEETYFWIGNDMLGENPSAFDIYDPELNIRYGTFYLSWLYRKYQSWDTAFAAYNAGPGNVNNWLEDREISDGNGNLVNIPFKETRNYVKKVNNAIEKYNKLYYKK